MNVPGIAAAALSKHYGPVTAVDRVSLQVHPGEVYALLGLNGAGKTTMIRMLLGLVRPSAGSASILGTPVTPAATSVWSRVGYLVETPVAYPELTVRENLDAVRRLRHLPGRGCIQEVLDRLALAPYADRRTATLSLGNAQRLGLAKALLHRPDVLVLDEPSNGLDPAGMVEIRTMLADLAAEHGTTVFLSSHLLAEVSRIATRVGILHQGRLVSQSTAGELTAQVRRWLEVAARDTELAEQTLRADGLDPEPGAGPKPDRVLILRDPPSVRAPERIAQLLVDAGCPPTRLAVEQEDLEHYFLRLVQP